MKAAVTPRPEQGRSPRLALPWARRWAPPRLRWWVALALVTALLGCSTELATPTEPLRLLQPNWPVAYLGEAFDGALRPTGGLRPYRFELVDGALPPGLTLEQGRLRGTPTQVGSYTFTIEVQDGNLSQGLLAHALEVRTLPTPVLRIDTPSTEVRGNLPLVLRVEDARGWLGARISISWDADAFRLGQSPAGIDGRSVLFSEETPGELIIEIAALGEARNGDFNIGRFSLEAIDEPQRAGLTIVSESRYAGGVHLAERREGAGR